ncbi:MAG: EamA family transporter [Steroidobacteraceae bacterium]|jgi:drug/metabolite transporter (DMT)-like permease
MTEAHSSLPAKVAAFAGIYLIWSTTYLAIAVAIRTVPPFSVGAMRYLTAGGLMYAWLRARESRPFDGLNIGGTILCGVLMSGVGNGLVMWAQQGIPSGVAALFVASLPMLILLLDWAFFSRKMPARLATVGVLIGLAGVAVLATHAGGLSGRIRPIHMLAVLAAELAWAVATLLQRRFVPASRILNFTCLQLLAGGVFQLAAALVGRDWLALAAHGVAGSSLLAVGYLTIMGTLVANNCYSYLIAHVSAHKVATYALVNPVIALALGVAVLGEKVSPAMFIASALVLLGVALILFQGMRRRFAVAFPR